MPLPDIVHRALLPDMLRVPLRLMQHWLGADVYSYVHFATIPNLKNNHKSNNLITNTPTELIEEFQVRRRDYIFNTPFVEIALAGKTKLLTADPNHPRYEEFYKLYLKHGYKHFLVVGTKSSIGTSLLMYISSKPIKWDKDISRKLRVFSRALHGHTHANLATYFDPYLFDIKPHHLEWLQTKVNLELTTKQTAQHFGVSVSTIEGAFKRLKERAGYSTELKLVRDLTRIGYLKPY